MHPRGDLSALDGAREPHERGRELLGVPAARLHLLRERLDGRARVRRVVDGDDAVHAGEARKREADAALEGGVGRRGRRGRDDGGREGRRREEDEALEERGLRGRVGPGGPQARHEARAARGADEAVRVRRVGARVVLGRRGRGRQREGDAEGAQGERALGEGEHRRVGHGAQDVAPAQGRVQLVHGAQPRADVDAAAGATGVALALHEVEQLVQLLRDAHLDAAAVAVAVAAVAVEVAELGEDGPRELCRAQGRDRREARQGRDGLGRAVLVERDLVEGVREGLSADLGPEPAAHGGEDERAAVVVRQGLLGRGRVGRAVGGGGRRGRRRGRGVGDVEVREEDGDEAREGERRELGDVVHGGGGCAELVEGGRERLADEAGRVEAEGALEARGRGGRGEEEGEEGRAEDEALEGAELGAGRVGEEGREGKGAQDLVGRGGAVGALKDGVAEPLGEGRVARAALHLGREEAQVELGRRRLVARGRRGGRGGEEGCGALDESANEVGVRGRVVLEKLRSQEQVVSPTARMMGRRQQKVRVDGGLDDAQEGDSKEDGDAPSGSRRGS